MGGAIVSTGFVLSEVVLRVGWRGCEEVEYNDSEALLLCRCCRSGTEALRFAVVVLLRGRPWSGGGAV